MKRLFIILSILIFGMAGCASLCPVCPPQKAFFFVPTPFGPWPAYIDKGQITDGKYMTEEEFKAFMEERAKEYQEQQNEQDENTELDETIDEAMRQLDTLFF